MIYSSRGEFDQAAYGMKMLAAGAKIRRTRCVVIKGKDRTEGKLTELGIALQYVPAPSFMAEYEQMGVPAEVVAMADAYMRKARSIRGATRQDVINGIKSYRVAENILQREGADAISMDCLGALGASKISLPCIAWSRMNDDGIPAACEADLGALASHIFVQALFDRPGFQQDPVPDTTCDAIIGAHCSCPTKLSGFDGPEEPFDLMHHHGNRDAVPRTLWKVGQRITCLDVLPGEGTTPTELLVSAGTVMDNLDVPAGWRLRGLGTGQVRLQPGCPDLPGLPPTVLLRRLQTPASRLRQTLSPQGDAGVIQAGWAPLDLPFGY